MFRSISRCALLAALCACAAPAATQPTTRRDPAVQTSTVASTKQPIKQKVICENEAPLGSHFTTRRCRNAEVAEQERQRLQDELLRARSTKSTAGGN
jgi:hypothetical protein